MTQSSERLLFLHNGNKQPILEGARDVHVELFQSITSKEGFNTQWKQPHKSISKHAFIVKLPWTVNFLKQWMFSRTHLQYKVKLRTSARKRISLFRFLLLICLFSLFCSSAEGISLFCKFWSCLGAVWFPISPICCEDCMFFWEHACSACMSNSFSWVGNATSFLLMKGVDDCKGLIPLLLWPYSFLSRTINVRYLVGFCFRSPKYARCAISLQQNNQRGLSFVFIQACKTIMQQVKKLG